MTLSLSLSLSLCVLYYMFVSKELTAISFKLTVRSWHFEIRGIERITYCIWVIDTLSAEATVKIRFVPLKIGSAQETKHEVTKFASFVRNGLKSTECTQSP